MLYEPGSRILILVLLALPVLEARFFATHLSSKTALHGGSGL